MQKILFSGLGRMGLPMIKNLSKHNKSIYAYDINKSQVQNLKQYGIKSVDEIQGKIDLFISMVPDVNSLKKFIQSEVGPLQIGSENSLHIDCSTIGPVNAKEVNEILQNQQKRFVDAPVSGGVIGAQNQSLSFMVGAQNKNDFEEAQKILQHMGQKIKLCGDIGMGQTAKIANNLALAIQMRSIAEAMTYSQSMGIDQNILLEILSVSTSNCWSLTKSNPFPGVVESSPSSRDYNNGFASDLARKDLQIAYENAKEKNINLEFVQKCLKDYENICELGYAQKDFGIIYKYINNELYKKSQLNTTS